MSALGDLRITDSLVIPAWEISETFVRASGPGGQNVNKVSTAVQLSWMPSASSLPAPVKSRFLALQASRITEDGRIIIVASEHRSQLRNREAARARLAGMVLRAATAPKRRIATKPTQGSVRRRIAAKKRRSEIKSLRGGPAPED